MTKPNMELMKRAVSYLRVSRPDQAKRGGEAEGYSLPAQREANARKAASIDADVVDEYIEPGESARTDQRPALQAMLARIREQRDIDIVIVHKVNRWARNRYDDAMLGAALKSLGVQLVSATENIDETPPGKLMHGILATIAEFESANLATEVLKGSVKKAELGGTPTLAPIGYLNVRRRGKDGYEQATVITDRHRAPLIAWAFEAFATGDYTLNTILEQVTAKGLKTKPMGTKHPPRILHLSHMQRILTNPYYKGIVRYRNIEYEGKHKALVSAATWQKVQDILTSHRQGDKTRKHDHYLRGSLRCGRCQARLCYTRSRGNGGYYEYYLCLGHQKKRGACGLPSVPMALIEKEIALAYRLPGNYLTRAEADLLRITLMNAFDQATKANRHESQRQQRRILGLQAEKKKILHAYLQGAIDTDTLKEEQARITRETIDARTVVDRTQADIDLVQHNLKLALRLLMDLAELYPAASPTVRRLVNQAMFELIEITEDGLADVQLAPPFNQLMDANAEIQGLSNREHLETSVEKVLGRSAFKPGNPIRRLTPSHVTHGLSNATLVEVRGFEPLASALRTLRSTN